MPRIPNFMLSSRGRRADNPVAMTLGLDLHPTAPGLMCAAASLIAGAPLFSDGMRAVRLRRQLERLRTAPLSEWPSGFVHVSGRVALESPMFAPLSGKPCAGWRLELRSSTPRTIACLDERRPFQLIDGTVLAHVAEHGAAWELAVSAERDIAHDEPISERLDTLLMNAGDVAWARRAGATLHVVERALLAGAECHVIGTVQHSRTRAYEMDDEWLRTGTDDGPSEPAGSISAREYLSEPDLRISSGEHLDFLLVTDRKPSASRLSLPAWRMLGAAAGPAMGLAGLTYLASALDWLRAQ
jgi:hypothetical protein